MIVLLEHECQYAVFHSDVMCHYIPNISNLVNKLLERNFHCVEFDKLNAMDFLKFFTSFFKCLNFQCFERNRVQELAIFSLFSQIFKHDFLWSCTHIFNLFSKAKSAYNHASISILCIFDWYTKQGHERGLYTKSKMFFPWPLLPIHLLWLLEKLFGTLIQQGFVVWKYR